MIKKKQCWFDLSHPDLFQGSGTISVQRQAWVHYVDRVLK